MKEGGEKGTSLTGHLDTRCWTVPCVLYVAMLIQLFQAASAASADDDEYSAKFHAIDVMCHIGSLIETVAFMQHNMLVLRLLEMLSTAMLAVYSIFHTRNSTDCHFIWYIVHFSVNSYHVALYLRAYLSISFTETESHLLKGLFSMYSRVQFAELKRNYAWRTFQTGESLMQEGEPVQQMLLLVSGSIEVVKAGEVIDTLNTDLTGPQFFGEMSFFTMQVASATIRVQSEEAHAIAWDMDQMRQLCSSSGHSLVETTFRQLPALFATQLAHRAQEASAGLSRMKQSQQVKLTASQVEMLTAESPTDKNKSMRKLFKDIVGQKLGKGLLTSPHSSSGGRRSSRTRIAHEESMVSSQPPSPSSPCGPRTHLHHDLDAPTQSDPTRVVAPPAYPRVGSTNTLGRPSSPQGEVPHTVLDIGQTGGGSASPPSRPPSKGAWMTDPSRPMAQETSRPSIEACVRLLSESSRYAVSAKMSNTQDVGITSWSEADASPGLPGQRHEDGEV
mmetsp:Transcript_47348/g.86998  ORF Transcript_47348/g.86998 Transcript_47348/m.86998 type:complete len:502 (-) Transcript_47348:55-1560(-)